MKKFEYKVLEIEAQMYWDRKLKNVRLEDKMNDLGNEGWELVCAAEYNSGGLLKSIVFTFKREKP
ncbi:MAG TPA: DUF4177 domain-containing protein [Phnomibacter sp.]|nr:DUF4177 domain-containing protein [Phnomibacter sp.]